MLLHAEGLGFATVRGMEETAASHLALAVAARPHRLAVFVPVAVDGLDWRRSLAVAMAAQAGVWGGQGNLLLPYTEDFTDREVFWRLTEVFDPDSLVLHLPS